MKVAVPDQSSLYVFLPLFFVPQGHLIEVKSNGGQVTGVGTIHGNVDISTCGDGVRTALNLHSAVIRGQQWPKYNVIETQHCFGLTASSVMSCVFTVSGCQEAPGHHHERFHRTRPSEGESHLCRVQLRLLLLRQSRTGTSTW